jgi:uncharacterized caspase-like protein
VSRRQFLMFACAQIAVAQANETDSKRPTDARVLTSRNQRLALIIGNSTYKHFPLKNPVNDARAIALALTGYGYEAELKENLGFREMIAGIREFTDRSVNASLRLIYFAGHGIQIRGRNHLLPIDLDELTAETLPTKTIALDDVLDRFVPMTRGANIIILDACRVNPFSGTEITTPEGRKLQFRNPLKQGLAPVNSPYGTLIAFSTAPGRVAHDNPNEVLGLYAKHFLAQLQAPGLVAEQLFKRVRVAVAEETSRLQVPWEASSLTGDVCLRTGPAGCS